MNERIKEFAKQAEQYALDKANEGDDEDYDYSFDDDFQEKFAELIVRECIELAMNERLRYSSYDKQADWAKQLMMLHCATSMDNYKILLQEHFGVEE
jgi:hypothetical protein